MTPIKEFNELKSLFIAMGNKFTKKEFVGMLHTIEGLPKYPNLFACLQPDILCKVSHGNRRAGEPAMFSFKNPEPVYYRVLEHAIDACTKAAKQYKRTHYENKKNTETTPTIGTCDEVQKAIELLKAHGYKILKPTTSYEEI
jgi:hypothetical protein